MTLYEIEKSILDCVDEETGEIIDIDKLDRLEIERDKKIENIACWIIDLKAEAEAIKKQKQVLADRQRVAENKAETLKKMLKDYLNGNKFKTARTSISYRKSSKIQADLFTMLENLDDEQKKEYLIYKTPEPNKTAIKKAIEKGETIAGCEVIEEQNLIIK